MPPAILQLGVSYDPGELKAFEDRINASLRALGDRKLFDQIAVFAERENRKVAFSGLDRYGRALRPWRVRKGDSDYHGEDYRNWTNGTVLIPFGTRSRRIDAFVVRYDRNRFLGFGTGKASLFVGFSLRAGAVPQWWKYQGRDVLGMPPRTQRGVSLLLKQHSSKAHGLLRRGGRAVARVTGLFGF